jgi:biopolymer transport protein ExbB
MRKLFVFLGVFAVTAYINAINLMAADSGLSFQMLKEKFIEGDWRFMSTILVCMIIGLALSIERVITLNLASANVNKLLKKVDDKLAEGDFEGAKEACKSTPGPAAAVLFEGLKNAKYGPESVEKAIVAYGSVQMGLLEKGLVWISLFIAVAPMLGFLGTVVGMIQAFDKIQQVGDISPTIVAGGIKVALLTTIFGLIVAIILQLFYNYLITKIDGIVNKMEEGTITFLDMLIERGVFNKN